MAKKPDTYQAVASRFDKTLLARVNKGGGLQELELSKLTARPGQPRRYFDERELEALAASIKAEGVRNPLHVRRGVGEMYEVLAGERRLRAARRTGLERVPVIVHDLSNAEADTLAVLDNLHRADLNPIEEMEAVLLLVQAALDVDRKMAIAKIRAAANVAKGRAQKEISNEELHILETLFDQSVGRLTILSFANARLPLLKLPDDVYQAVLKGELGYTVALTLRGLSDDTTRKALLERAIKEGLTRDDLRKLIQEVKAPPVSVRRLEAKVKPARALFSSERLKQIPPDKRREFSELVEEFVARAQIILK